MEVTADMDICLKVHSKCESCLMKMIQVLRCIRGVYFVNWDDAQQSSLRICGEVNASYLLKVVMAPGEHAHLVNLKLNHPQHRHNYYNYASMINAPFNRISYTDRPYYPYQKASIEYPYGRVQTACN
ncbi:hypothetical protein L6452_00294 [Arctium lappa]|uniref:Uncharacterized protein n=1 Tax=Arctium lappa TaxID=4217 RepID=A0ACB9FD19_ARCLA|nr:hypothetical protein L6452_00294 [Arctium lappa]